MIIHKKPKSEIYGADSLSEIEDEDDLDELDAIYESMDNQEVQELFTLIFFILLGGICEKYLDSKFSLF